MNDFPDRRPAPRVAAVAVIVAAVVLMMPASLGAQAPASKGIRSAPLSPPKKLQPTTPVESQTPAAPPRPPARPGAAKTLPGAPGAGGPAPIDVQSLGALDADSAGTLGVADGGFGPAMWEGTRRGLVERLLPRLPAETQSRAMRGLMRRLLLSAAKAPQGKSTGASLVALRVERLAAMGEIVGARDLLGAVRDRSASESLQRSEADVLFMANDNARACPLVARRIGASASVHWQKAFIFCQALAGEHDRAELGIGLLREKGVKDEVFYGLIDSLASREKFVIASLAHPTPLHFAIARAARARLPADVTSSNNPAVLRIVATSPNARARLRLEAAERAEAMGSLPTNFLRQLYAGITIPEDVVADLAKRKGNAPVPMARAYLYRNAIGEVVPTAVAETISRAIAMARAGGYYPSTARVYLPVLERLAPRRELLWFAPEVVRAFIAAGKPQAAGSWLDLLHLAAPVNKEAEEALARLLPVLRIAGGIGAESWEPAALTKWWALETRAAHDKARNPDGAVVRASRLYNLLEALGDPVPGALWEALLDGQPHTTTIMPGAAVWRSLEAAAAAGRPGETVLLALVALGQAGPTQASPVVLRRVIESLRRAGLEREARLLAGEVAIAANL